MLAALIGLVSCSGGGSTPSVAPSSGASQAAISVALGNEVALSSGYSYDIQVTETNAAGQVITGPYPSAITLATSDAADTGFSATATGQNLSSSVTITSSTQPVFFVYDGAKLSSPVTLTASSSSAPSAQYTFTAAGNGTGTTTNTTSSTISSVSIAPNGALPQQGTAGSVTLTVAGYATSGSLVTGTYANPIILTSNDTADLTFSVNGAAATASATVPSSGAIVILNYDGATVPSSTTISASASGVPTVSIPFKPATSSGTTTSGAITGLSISTDSNGSMPQQGSAGTFTLNLTAMSGGTTLSGTYPSSIVLTTNDASDVTFSVNGGAAASTATVTSSSQTIIVNYDGKAVPTGTTINASAGSVSFPLPFTPAAAATPAPASIATLSLVLGGATPQVGTSGSFPLTVTGQTSGGSAATGTYATPILLTTNDGTDIGFSVNGSAPSSSASVTSSSQTVIVSYDGASVPSGTSIYATSADAGDAIGFSTSNGSSASGAITGLSVSTNAAPQQGSAGTFPLNVSAMSGSGTLMGTYPSSIVLTTNDGSDITFSVGGASATSTATITSSMQSVVVNYDGNALPSNTTITASAGSVSFPYPFPVAVNAVPTPSPITGVTVMQAGPTPQIGTPASVPLTVTAETSGSTAPLTGTYASPILLTTNDSSDIGFSVNGGASSSSASITSSSQTVVVSYDGAALPSGTSIYATTAGVGESSPFTAMAASTTKVASVTLTQVGALPSGETAAEFGINVNAVDSGGNPISGTYTTPVVITSNDTSQLGLSTSYNGPFAASASVPNSSTVVYVQYNGGEVPSGTYLQAANVKSSTFTFSTTSSQALFIQTLYVTTSGAPPDTNSYGSVPISISAFDQNGNPINGTYPSPIDVTINNATELSLSLGSYSPAVDCSAANPNDPSPCPNVAAVVLNASGQTIFGDYAINYANSESQISVSISGSTCASVSFPAPVPPSSTNPASTPTGSTPFTCQAPNPTVTPTPGPTSAARHRHFQLEPKRRS